MIHSIITPLISSPYSLADTLGFDTAEESRGQGVGDDSVSWGFDGIRRNLWGDNQIGQSAEDNTYGVEWNNGDVLGQLRDNPFAQNILSGAIR